MCLLFTEKNAGRLLGPPGAHQGLTRRTPDRADQPGSGGRGRRGSPARAEPRKAHGTAWRALLSGLAPPRPGHPQACGRSETPAGLPAGRCANTQRGAAPGRARAPGPKEEAHPRGCSSSTETPTETWAQFQVDEPPTSRMRQDRSADLGGERASLPQGFGGLRGEKGEPSGPGEALEAESPA